MPPEGSSGAIHSRPLPPRPPIRRGCCGLPPVRHVKHAPSFQVVPHIHKGYRVGFDVGQCFWSLFTLHNETLNTWTHLLGALYVIYMLCSIMGGLHPLHPMPWTEWLALLVFLLCAVACLGLSATYHLLGSASERIYGVLLRADLVGIALLIFGSYVPGIYYAFHCFPAWQGLYQTVCVVNLIMGLIGAVLTDLTCPKQSAFRTYTFAFLVGFGLVPAAHWCIMAPASVRGMFLDNLAAMFACYFLGFTFWHTRFPECVWPYRFDIFLSSHQLWHICIVLAVLSWLHGIIEYHHALHEDGCQMFHRAP